MGFNADAGPTSVVARAGNGLAPFQGSRGDFGIGTRGGAALCPGLVSWRPSGETDGVDADWFPALRSAPGRSFGVLWAKRAEVQNPFARHLVWRRFLNRATAPIWRRRPEWRRRCVPDAKRHEGPAQGKRIGGDSRRSRRPGLGFAPSKHRRERASSIAWMGFNADAGPSSVVAPAGNRLTPFQGLRGNIGIETRGGAAFCPGLVFWRPLGERGGHYRSVRLCGRQPPSIIRGCGGLLGRRDSSLRFSPARFMENHGKRILAALVFACPFPLAWGPTFVSTTASAQGPQVVEGQAVPSSGRPPRPARPGGPSPSGSGPESGKPEAGKPGAEGSDAKEEKKEGDGDAKLEVIRRESVGEEKADPAELRATVGEDGRVAFQFRNQAWAGLVEWLSDICDRPFDWQELPGDRVNLASPGRYTVPQTLDLFNRHLLARGYVILEVDAGYTVVKTETVNPALVRRVDERELAGMAPYSYVRTLLDVGWLSAEKLAEELKPMISGNGRLTALTTTNRIEAMDAAVNLRQVSELLAQERDSASRDALAPEFKLRYIPAEEAKRLLEQFLGVEEKDEAPMTPQQMQQMQRMRQQQQQQGQGKPPEEDAEIAIVANVRQNSVLIRAPADRVAIAAEFVKRIDVPGESMRSLTDIQSRVEVFRLASLDPEKLIEIVSEMNVLEPTTRLRADKENQAVIASGSAADRFIIGSLIERLDGSGREFDVLQLRRLNATEVAESITFLMGQEKKDDQQSNRRSYYYGFMSNNEESKKEQDEFRVAANARYNQVLLWANPTEMDEVRSLLVKLGELPPPGGNRQTVRVIDASATPETYEYLQNLRRQWRSIGGGELEIPGAEEFKDPIAESKEIREAKAKRVERDKTDEESSGDGSTNKSDAKSGGESGGEDGRDQKDSGEEKGDDPSQSDDVVTVWTVGDRGMAGRDSRLVSQQDVGSGTSEASTGGAPAEKAPAEDGVDSVEEFDRRFGTRAGKPEGTPDDGDEDSKGDGSREEDSGDGEIRITIDREGNLVLSGGDATALDRLENLMMQSKPPRRPYRVFPVRYATASWVSWNLEDYFEAEDEEDTGGDPFYRYYFGSGDDSDDEGPTGLGRSGELRFVADDDTNTIVVTGGNAEQLRTIAELIELWDVEPAVDQRRMRYTKLVRIRYSRASEVADTVKEAYRDLLSSNDKAFGQGQRGGQGGGGNPRAAQGNGGQRNRDGDGSGLTDQESGREGGGSDFSFKGKLSIGVDEVGNTLVVSAEGEALLDLVVGVIERLDESAMPSGGLEVLTLSGNVGSISLSQALEAFGVVSGNGDTVSGNNGRGRNGRTGRGDNGRRFGGANGRGAVDGSVGQPSATGQPEP